MKGSNDFFYRTMDKGDTEVALIGLDSNQFAQMKIDTTWVDLWLVGYVTSGAVFFQDAIPHTTEVIGTYDDVDITGDLLGSDDANGAILNLLSAGAEWFGVRPKGAPDPPYDFYRRSSRRSTPTWRTAMKSAFACWAPTTPGCSVRKGRGTIHWAGT